MPYVTDSAPDAYLGYIRTNTDRLFLCSQEPSTYTEAVTTYALGYKSGPTLGAIGDRAPDGRKFTVEAITDGGNTSNGTATHWALVDDTDELLAANELDASQVITAGNPFTTAAFDVGVPDPVTE